MPVPRDPPVQSLSVRRKIVSNVGRLAFGTDTDPKAPFPFKGKRAGWGEDAPYRLIGIARNCVISLVSDSGALNRARLALRMTMYELPSEFPFMDESQTVDRTAGRIFKKYGGKSEQSSRGSFNRTFLSASVEGTDRQSCQSAIDRVRPRKNPLSQETISVIP
jgi:hypothetical protein